MVKTVKPWYESSGRTFEKKLNSFWKKDKAPDYNTDTYGYVPNHLLLHIKYVKNQNNNHSIFYKPNLSTFLSMIWLSQQPQYRNIYYTWCCFLTRFTTVYYKPYVQYMIKNSMEMKLSVFDKQIRLFKLLESYYHTVPHLKTFKSDYFFYDNNDYPYLLPYKNYIFKADLVVYGILWVNVERLRQKKYNEYVRGHYMLHQPKYTPVRVRYIVKNSFTEIGKVLSSRVIYHQWQLRCWYLFFLSARQKKYQIILSNIQTTSNSYTAPAIYTLNNSYLFDYYQTTHTYLNTHIWNLVDDYQKLNTSWFRGLIYTPVMWTLNKGFVDYIYQFPSQSRLDVIAASDYILAHGLGSEVYDRLMEKQMINIKKQAVGEFLLKDSIQDYFITHDLIKSVVKPQIYDQLIDRFNDYSFDSHSVNLLVSQDIFDSYLATRLFSHQARVSPLKIKQQVHLIKNAYVFKYIRDYILCGKFYKVPGYMYKVMGVMSYFYWRSYNTTSLHQAHKGRLHLYHYMQKLKIQLLLSQQLYNVYKLVFHIWNVSQINVNGIGLNDAWNYIAVNYTNWLHEYSYLNFFCLFKNSKEEATLNYYQQLYMNKSYTDFSFHIVVRQYLNNYMTIFSELRRASFDQNIGTCIHSKNPDHLKRWLVHVNWMRVIGLTRSQLPFYAYPEISAPEEISIANFDDYLQQQNPQQDRPDYLKELIKKTPRHHYVDIYNSDLFVIDKSISSVKLMEFKPYIKIVNMLYEE